MAWFESWFDTEYYHQLYSNRDSHEATAFIQNLILTLDLPPHVDALDMACGKGRHSLTLADHGFNVLGVDLSSQSINYAKQFERDNLNFRVHDMRKPIQDHQFDLIGSFFTSFGYFNTTQEDTEVLQAVSTSLKTGGYYILDFLNPNHVRRNLVSREEKYVGATKFELSRNIDNGSVVKSIVVIDGTKVLYFQEKVRLYDVLELQRAITTAGMYIQKMYGSYQLDSFDITKSQRAIYICKKL